MTTQLKPYPDYSDYNLPWFGPFPSHWGVKRIGAVLRERGESNKDGQVEQVLSVMKDVGVILYSEKGNVGNKASEDVTRYKVVRPNDIVVNCMNVIIGSVGISKYTGCLSQVYYVLTLRDSNNDPRYIDLLFRHKPFQKSLIRIGNGILAHRMRIPMELLKAELIPLPPLEEQQKIVNFIQQQDRRIRRFIRNKKRLIELLLQQKQLIVQMSLSNGTDPSAPCKYTGIPWIGTIPDSWAVMPLKWAFSSMDYGISDSSIDDGKIPVLTMGNITNGEVTEPRKGGVNQVDPDLILQKNDLLFNRTNSAELVGKVGLFKSESIPVTFASYLVRLRCRDGVSPDYMNIVLNSRSILDIARRLAVPSLHQSNLNPTRYGRIHIALPPYAEQLKLVESISENCLQLDNIISRAKREIELVQEYRTRLIADAVTGKIDLRSVPLEAVEDSNEEDLAEIFENGFDSDSELTSEDEELIEEAAYAN